MPWEFEGDVRGLTLVASMDVKCKKYCEYRLFNIKIYSGGRFKGIFVGRRSERLPKRVTDLITSGFFKTSVNQIAERLKINLDWFLSKFDQQSPFD